MAEYELTGDAFTGTVTARDEGRFVPGDRPGSQVWRPTITLRTGTDTRVGLAVGTEVKSPARPGQGARILDVRQEDDGGHTVVLQLKGGFANKRKPPAPSGILAETGEELTYTTLNLTAMPSALPDEENTPWTHGGPPQPYEPTDEDAEETWE